MDKVAQLSKRDRNDLFQEASVRKGNMSPAVLEKDFWVCWTLKHLFAITDPSARLIFKGGTSLSKVFEVIGRFSEDIDLSFNRDDLGFEGERDPKGEMSGRKRDKLLVELKSSCESYISDSLMPALVEDFFGVIGKPGVGETPWSLSIDDQDHQTINFSYPAVVSLIGTAVPAYIRPVVRLEMGGRSDPWPSGEYEIQPYVAEIFPDLFGRPSCSINTLQAERTFWEKVTLLHAEFHRPEGKTTGTRLSRHYYDLACLAQSPVRDRAIKDLPLLRAVVEHKQIFFRSGWAHYKTACPGTFRLIPPDRRLPLLRSDYRKMQEMFFEEPPTFESILETLEKLERDINNL